MTETAFYILLALTEPRHGYGITKFTSQLTENRIKLGSGTVYGTLAKMHRDGLIEVHDDTGNKTVYNITDTGRKILRAEVQRIKLLYGNAVALENTI